MYRCTECKKEYSVCPDYCDCGNNSFEEIIESSFDKPVINSTKTSSKEEFKRIREQKLDRQKAFITIGISLLISILIIILPPHKVKKMEKVQQRAVVENMKIPDVNTFWDDTLPSKYRKSASVDKLPVLNYNFAGISSELRNYLVNAGEEFSSQWNYKLVDGSGECKIEFSINKDGVIINKKMNTRSRNESLDDSVLLAMSKITNLDIPPYDYKGERIILAFKIDENKTSKVYFPTK
ncbi:MAG: TonB C-terminal domain-containing protein [Candidatus Gastranaerophilales bacterium]|nr:TonB C-terminal domain-containing protein [Candidatus Gastranaerophilales bacterium]